MSSGCVDNFWAVYHWDRPNLFVDHSFLKLKLAVSPIYLFFPFILVLSFSLLGMLNVFCVHGSFYQHKALL